jgi:HSP20 family protein
MVTLSPLNSVLDRMVTLSRTMDGAFGASDKNALSGSQNAYWVPALDAWETEHAFVVQLDLPGVSPEKVDITFERNTLTVQGTRGATIQTPEQGEMKIYFSERVAGSFTRTLRFPQYVEGDKIGAKFADGVLTITLPKAEAAKARKITIASPVASQQVPSSQPSN